MAIALDVAPAPKTLTGNAEPCCPPSECRYRPSRVHWYLAVIASIRRDGLEPAEAMEAYLDRIGGASGRVRFNGPARRWATDIVADVDMARRAGCTDDASIARHLCPFALMDDGIDDSESGGVSCRVVGIPVP